MGCNRGLFSPIRPPGIFLCKKIVCFRRHHKKYLTIPLVSRLLFQRVLKKLKFHRFQDVIQAFSHRRVSGKLNNRLPIAIKLINILALGNDT